MGAGCVRAPPQPGPVRTADQLDARAGDVRERGADGAGPSVERLSIRWR